MFRNQYDSEITLYSPEGQLLQIEYAKNAANNGNLLFAIKSTCHVVFVSLDRDIEYITKKTNKIFSINENTTIGITGITEDGILLHTLIENKVKEYEIGNNIPMSASNLAFIFSKIFHTNTVYSGTRPFGVNILIGSYDKNNSSIFKINQDGFFKDNSGTAIGKESDVYKKIINCFAHNFKTSSVDELVYYIIQFVFEKEKETYVNFFIAKKINICLTGKKLNFTFLNYKISKFFTKLYFYIEKKTQV